MSRVVRRSQRRASQAECLERSREVLPVLLHSVGTGQRFGGLGRIAAAGCQRQCGDAQHGQVCEQSIHCLLVTIRAICWSEEPLVRLSDQSKHWPWACIPKAPVPPFGTVNRSAPNVESAGVSPNQPPPPSSVSLGQAALSIRMGLSAALGPDVASGTG